MESEQSLQIRVRELLSSKGYPQDSVVADFGIADDAGRRIGEVDFAIVDPSRRELLAIIETKSGGRHAVLDSAAALLHHYARALSDPPVPAYLALPRDTSDATPRFFALTGLSSFKEISPDEFPKFDALRVAVATSKKAQIQSASKTTADTLRRYCLLIASVAALLVLSDVVFGLFHVQILTAERITLIALIAALVVIPYAAKLKILGIEFERYVEDSVMATEKSSERRG